MSAFGDTGLRVVGTMTARLQARVVAATGERQILELVELALSRWARVGLPGAGVEENDHNVQLAGHLRQVRASDHRFYWLQPVPEAPALSHGMLEGRETSRRAKRPDISFLDSLETGWSVECKKLSESWHPRHYVDEGVVRFVLGQYSPEKPLGVMVGYVYNRTVPAVASAINGRIRRTLDTSQEMVPHPPAAGTGRVSRAKSTHPRVNRQAVVIHHFLIHCD